MVCVILLLGLLAHLGEACRKKEGNGQGPGKGDLLSFSGRKCLFAHSVCANFSLNAHRVCANLGLNAHNVCLNYLIFFISFTETYARNEIFHNQNMLFVAN